MILFIEIPCYIGNEATQQLESVGVDADRDEFTIGPLMYRIDEISDLYGDRWGSAVIQEECGCYQTRALSYEALKSALAPYIEVLNHRSGSADRRCLNTGERIFT